jgi:hypothetical protein
VLCSTSFGLIAALRVTGSRKVSRTCAHLSDRVSWEGVVTCESCGLHSHGWRDASIRCRWGFHSQAGAAGPGAVNYGSQQCARWGSGCTAKASYVPSALAGISSDEAGPKLAVCCTVGGRERHWRRETAVGRGGPMCFNDGARAGAWPMMVVRR